MTKLSSKIIALALGLIFCRQGFAQQKQPFDMAFIDKAFVSAGGNSVQPGTTWPLVSDVLLSPKGGYVCYDIAAPAKSSSMIIASLTNSWKRAVTGGDRIYFSMDERTAYMQVGDSLHIIKLNTNEPDGLIAVRSLNGNGFFGKNSSWLAYQEKKGGGKLILVNLQTGKKRELDHVSAYQFDYRQPQWLLLKKDENKISGLVLYNLNTNQAASIHTEAAAWTVSQYGFSSGGQQVWFITMDEKKRQKYWIYQLGSKTANCALSDTDKRIPEGYKPGRFAITNSLARNGKWLIIPLEQIKSPAGPAKPKTDRGLSVLSYKDIDLGSPQTGKRSKPKPPLMAAFSTDGKHFRIVSGNNGYELGSLFIPYIVGGDEILVSKTDSSRWEKLGGPFNFPQSYYLLSLIDGKISQVYKNASRLQSLCFNFTFSPDGHWLLYFDQDKKNWFSYELKTGLTRNLTTQIATSFAADFGDHTSADALRAVSTPAGWLNEKVLLYDNYDLWVVDVSGNGPVENITAGYGNAHKVELRIINPASRDDIPQTEYKAGDTLYLTAFNPETKENGFFRTVIGSHKRPELLTMGPYLYYKTETQRPVGNNFDFGKAPIKAAQANRWIVERQTASEYPNYFVTDDWKHFKQLTDLQPQKTYNWLTAELVNYKQLDGTPGQGILYKPEDFDPQKHYPVIIHYYEKMTERVYEFPYPAGTDNALNIPWFVSHGYLVFTPDIHYTRAAESNITYGQSAFNSVEAAAIHLSNLPYVNVKRIGLQGHSFGAFETNYIVTHSHRFAAAEEFSGTSDAVTNYLVLKLGDGIEVWSNESDGETGQQRLYATLWQRPDLYLRESAVLHADSVTTPLLLVHTKLDGAVPWRQGQELFVALRRLQKPAWLLLYEKDSHSLQIPEDVLDHTIRLTQFFDHLLKGYPPPGWMTKDAEGRLNEDADPYALDPKGSCGPDCPICKKKDYADYYKMLETEKTSIHEKTK